MSRRLACVACRQNKVKCNTAETFPLPCERCSSRKLECKADPKYKRVATRKRLEELTNELDRLKRAKGEVSSTETSTSENNASIKPGAASSSVSATPIEVHGAVTDVQCATSSVMERVSQGRTFVLAQAVFDLEETQDMFKMFFQCYHEHLPVLDINIDPTSTYCASPLLFWTIIFTASRSFPAYQNRTGNSAAFSDMIAKSILNPHLDPLSTMEALLILSAWSLPVRRQVEDQRWLYNGLALQMALQNGLHQVGSEDEYQRQGLAKHASREARHTRIWRCWCYSNSLLSCELGLPSQVPFDHRQITAADTVVFQPNFLAKLQIALQVGRVHDALGQTGDCSNLADKLRMVRVLEKDMETLCAPLRLSYLQWTSSVEYLYLLTLLDMYSTYLCGVKPTSASPELQSCAARVASQMLEMFGNGLSSARESPGAAKMLLAYHPKWYFKTAATAIFVMVKIAYLDRLPSDQIREIEQTLRSTCNSLTGYSSQEGDEYHRVVRVIEVLSRKGVIDSTLAMNEVKTRFGASVHVELLSAATQWRKQHGLMKGASAAPLPAHTGSLDMAANLGSASTPNAADMGYPLFDDDYWATSVDLDMVDMDLLGDTGWSFT